MSQQDSLVFDVPLTMSRSVVLKTETGAWVPDPHWHQNVRATLHALLGFLISRQLLVNPASVLAQDFDQLVLRQSDLNEAGIALHRSGAIYRWLGSFDRSPNKSKTNYTMLDKALAKLAGAA
jgi:hypothetical protein